MTCNLYREVLTNIIRNSMKVRENELRQKCDTWAHEVGNAVVNRLTNDGRNDDVLTVAANEILRLRNLLAVLAKMMWDVQEANHDTLPVKVQAVVEAIENEIGPRVEGGEA